MGLCNSKSIPDIPVEEGTKEVSHHDSHQSHVSPGQEFRLPSESNPRRHSRIGYAMSDGENLFEEEGKSSLSDSSPRNDDPLCSEIAFQTVQSREKLIPGPIEGGPGRPSRMEDTHKDVHHRIFPPFIRHRRASELVRAIAEKSFSRIRRRKRKNRQFMAEKETFRIVTQKSLRCAKGTDKLNEDIDRNRMSSRILRHTRHHSEMVWGNGDMRGNIPNEMDLLQVPNL